MASAVLVTPVGTAQPATACANKQVPPPAVDTSENPAPGSKPLPPLPVPDKAVGGDRLAECGLVLPPNAQHLPDKITAQSWLLADLNSGDVLAAYDPHGRQRPASIIKVLLAMTVAKELRPDVTIVATQEDLDQECACVGLRNGGSYTVHELLQALVMSSGNDVAHALARQLGGVPSALRKMNALARELGALDTRATTPSGLDAPGTSTSAYDVAIIFRAAMKYPEFAEAVATQRIDFGAKSGKGTIPVVNSNGLLSTYEGSLGGKAGFTDDAQHTYVGAAERDGKRLVVTLLRGQATPLKITEQAAALLDWGFALGSASTNPVGKLVDGAPQPAKNPDTDAQPTQASGQQANDRSQAKEKNKEAMSSAFGNVGGPITIAAGVAVLLGLAMYLRNRRARAARAARAAQG
jgi:D-alanyl-D-alanine carboxypeptidase (penicillin-binding protein 5/6)